MFNWLMNMGDVTHAVQLALTPAFLLTGMAGILNAMANRLARIIDRGRDVTENNHDLSELPEKIKLELEMLERRRRAASIAITMCVLSALLICLVVAVLFLEALLNFNLKWLIGTLFMSSTLSLVIGLAFFLREVQLATNTMRIQTHPSQQKKD